MVEPTGLTWLYALALQAAAVVVLVYLVALLGARSFNHSNAPKSLVSGLASLVLLKRTKDQRPETRDDLA